MCTQYDCGTMSSLSTVLLCYYEEQNTSGLGGEVCKGPIDKNSLIYLLFTCIRHTILVTCND